MHQCCWQWSGLISQRRVSRGIQSWKYMSVYLTHAACSQSWVCLHLFPSHHVMYACVHICTYEPIYYICSTYVCTHACTHVCVCVLVCVRTYACTQVCVCTPVLVYANFDVCPVRRRLEVWRCGLLPLATCVYVLVPPLVRARLHSSPPSNPDLCLLHRFSLCSCV